jgi:ATPase family AAA domain-containing protein 2
MTIDEQTPRSPSPAQPLPQSEQALSSESHPTLQPLVSTASAPLTPAPTSDELPAPAPPAPEQHVEQIEVDREPTPLPDFYLDQNALAHLVNDLRDMTGLFTVEQLEQLRASCLGRVWAHRSDWNRDDLILDLSKMLRNFVDEVRADHEDEMLVSPIPHNS